MGEVTIREYELPKHGIPGLVPGTRLFRFADCQVFLSREKHFKDDIALRWHLSISHPARYPTWEEIKTARYCLMPQDIMVAMLLPPPDEYVNCHPNCFHLWEVPR